MGYNHKRVADVCVQRRELTEAPLPQRVRPSSSFPLEEIIATLRPSLF